MQVLERYLRGSAMKKTRKKIKLENTSDWPDWFALAVMRWLLKKINPRNKVVTVRLRNTSHNRHGHAYYTYSRTSCSVKRRVPLSKFPYEDDYGRYVWCKKILVRNRLELFVRLVAHEFRHLCKENQGISRQGAEHDAEQWALERIEEFRNGVWQQIRADYIQQRRAARAKRAAKQAEPVKDATIIKIEHAQKKLDEWEKQRDKAAKQAKKWQKKINLLNGALKRKQNKAAL